MESGEERRQRWPAEGGGAAGSGRRRFPCGFNQDGKTGSVPIGSATGTSPSRGSWALPSVLEQRPDLGLMVLPCVLLTPTDVASAALGSL